MAWCGVPASTIDKVTALGCDRSRAMKMFLVMMLPSVWASQLLYALFSAVATMVTAEATSTNVLPLILFLLPLEPAITHDAPMRRPSDVAFWTRLPVIAIPLMSLVWMATSL